MKPNLMSMEELDKVVRNQNADNHLRLRCRRELAQREMNQNYKHVWGYDERLRKEREFIYCAPGL